jgi:carboxypeptidase Q
MSYRRLILANFVPLCLLAFAFPAAAQLPPVQPAPLQKQIPSGPSCSADLPTSCESIAPKIIASVLGPSPMEENLRQLTDFVGGRVTGSPAAARAVAWGVEAFRRSGVDSVHTEKYTIPVTWAEGATRLDVLSPVPFPVHLVSIGWSPATPAAGIETDLVDVGEGTEADFARAGTSAKGAIVLIHSGVLRTWDDLFNEYLRAGGTIDRAVKASAAAILWTSTREHGLLYRHQNSLVGEIDRLPQAIVAREDAERLARYAAAGETVRVRLTMPNRIGGPMEQENVIAEIRGREKPDEFVILGAHLDSWELGTGALDNGCNAALVIEAARAIATSGVKPRRSIRFILFTGEEQGMLGSWAYARAHRAELDRAICVIVFDEGIGRVSGYSLGGRRDIEDGLREILRPIESWGATQHTYDAPLGTDNFDFLVEGVPTLLADQEEANYIVNYHAASDTFDKVDIRELKLHSALAAVTAYGIAERAERLGRRQSRVEIEALMKETGLDQQMHGFGVWDLWMQGKRGRQP